MLRQLMHLKRYEQPDPARMTRSRQNITRMVRQAESQRRKSVGDWLEVSIPWLFAEPKYGIALLFVAFAGLQFLGGQSRMASSRTGIYTSSGPAFSFSQGAETYSSNSISYPQLPDNVRLFSVPGRSDGSIKAASFELRP